MPEGDALHRVARRLQPLVGHVIEAESHHGRAQVLRVAERIDGLRLERVHAAGKNLLLTFEGGRVVRSHLRMKGRWLLRPSGKPIAGKPWLVLRGGGYEALLLNGPGLEIGDSRTGRLGPDIMVDPPDLAGMLARLRDADQWREVGEALLSQRLVAGIGNKWKAEGLFLAGLSPWRSLADVSDDDLRRALGATAGAMQSGQRGNAVYRRAGRPCPRCGEAIRSWPQGEAARMSYWCPTCQPGPAPRARKAGTARAKA